MPCRLNVSPQGVAQRDAAVWQFAQERRAPIVMLMSGGYTRASAGVTADSIARILRGLAKQHGGTAQQQAISGRKS